jgi:glycosyltransferase involved in cell wall biosynthesis
MEKPEMADWSAASPPSEPEITAAPRVSIGLPVYNGERFLAGAIASILAQTYTDFELIICDNASTDRTSEICRSFAGRDARVRYHRQPRNLGATANFNRCFELASGDYFKWAADDDLLEPRFLEKCIRALDRDPGAVLSQSLVKVIDEADRVLEIYDHSAFGTSSPRALDRFSGRLRGTCLEVFGVIRSDVLRDSALIQSYIGSDRTLLVDLALRGRFALVPEPLFINRDHLGRCTRITRARGDRRHIIAWYDTQLSYNRVLSTWQFHLACLRLIGRRVRSPRERVRCYARLLASLRPRTVAYLALEPLMVVSPGAFTLARAIKRAIRRPGRGHSQLPGSA